MKEEKTFTVLYQTKGSPYVQATTNPATVNTGTPTPQVCLLLTCLYPPPPCRMGSPMAPQVTISPVNTLLLDPPSAHIALPLLPLFSRLVGPSRHQSCQQVSQLRSLALQPCPSSGVHCARLRNLVHVPFFSPCGPTARMSFRCHRISFVPLFWHLYCTTSGV